MRADVIKKQTGLSLFSLIFLLLILGGIGVLALKIVPLYSEYFSILKEVKLIAAENKTPKEVRADFNLKSSAGYISAITGKDLEITRTASGQDISFSYEKRIHLVGPASLVFEFKGSSSGVDPS